MTVKQKRKIKKEPIRKKNVVRKTRDKVSKLKGGKPKKSKTPSGVKKKKPTSVLGDKKYKPSNAEAKEFTKKANSSHARLQMYIFYICFYKTYKMEPYNCKTLDKFIQKHLEMSRATVYRIYSVMCTRMTLELDFGDHNDISDAAFVRLGTLGRSIGDEGLRDFWEFLTDETEEHITEDVVLYYIHQYDRTGDLTPKHKLPNVDKASDDNEPSSDIESTDDNELSDNEEASNYVKTSDGVEPIKGNEKPEGTVICDEPIEADTSYLNPTEDRDLLLAYHHSVNKLKSPDVVKVDRLIRKLKIGEMAVVLSLIEDYLSLSMDKEDVHKV